MKKLKAILKLIQAKHFYLITANEDLQSENMQSDTNLNIIAELIKFHWDIFYKGIYNLNSKK